jgi:anti-sigma B factor antagonist
MDVSPGMIERSKTGPVWLLALRGEHDLTTAPVLQRELDDIYDSGSTVVVDLTEATFIDSSIVKALVYGCDRATRRAEHHFAVVSPAGGVASRVLDLVVGQRVPRFETQTEAVAAVGRQAAQ